MSSGCSIRPSGPFDAASRVKAHIGVDAKEGHVHSVATSAAHVSDVHRLADLLHGEERKVWGDGDYRGQTEAIRRLLRRLRI